MNEVSGPVKRTYLEKLGISTKRNDERTIGQFGSGSKLAPIAALRKGWRWISVGSDLEGDYQMEYITEEDEDGFQHIFFDYGDYKTPSSYTVDAGLLSWTDSFQIFREAMANAIDAYLAEGLAYTIDYVTEIENVPGHFCTYLTADVELVHFVEHIEKYFIINRKPICTIRSYSTYKLYTPYDESIGVYLKGVNVNTNEQDALSTIFDIDGPFTINEERRITNLSYSLETALKHYILPAVKDLDVLEAYLSKAPFDPDYWEYHVPSYGSRILNDLIPLAWKNIFGDMVVVPSGVSDANLQSLRLKGYDYIVVPSEFWYELLAENGVETIVSILEIDPNFEIAELDPIQKRVFLKAIEIVGKYDKGIETVDNIFPFKPNANQMRYDGIYSPMGKGLIYISTRVLDSLEETLGILIHELDHHLTGVKDSDMFRNSADIRIGKLLAEMYG